MKSKGVIGEQIEKAVEEMKAVVSPLKAAEEVVAAVTGGQASAQNLSELEDKDRQEKAKGIAYLKRVIKDEQEAGQQSTSDAVSKEGGAPPLTARQGKSQEKKAGEMPLTKLPAGISRQPGLKRPKKGKPEIKGFSTG